MMASSLETSEGDKHMIAESEHVDRLHDCDIRRLGLLIGDSSVGLSDWKTLAKRLSISNEDVRRIETMMRDSGDGRLVVPGEEILKLWRRKEKSTIRVLRQVLGGMERDDIVRELDDMRLSK